MNHETAKRFMETLQHTELTGDVEPLVSMFADDAELSNLAMIDPVKGIDQIRKFWQNYLSVFDQIHSRFTHTTESSERAVLEWVSEGSLSNGEPISYRGVSVLETENGYVRRFRTYYDSAVFLPQGAKR